MYLIALGPHVYERRGGSSFTLVEALHEVYGVGHASILRLDGSVVVSNAGSSCGPLTYHSTSHGARFVERRPRRPVTKG